MRSLTFPPRRAASALLIVGSILTPLCAHARPQAGSNEAPTDDASDARPAIADVEIPRYRLELLDTAFRAASAMPLMPHIKNRSRAQEAVMSACFELDQPLRALRYSEEIANWRKGVGYAAFAYYCAERGHVEEVERYLDLAYQVVESIQGDDAQDWHRDRIRAKIAATYLLLGRSEEAALFGGGLVDSEVGTVDAQRARTLDGEGFDRTIAALDAAAVIGDFDQLRNAGETYAQLFDSFYADSEKRQIVEKRMRVMWEKLPPSLRLEALLQLGDVALANKDEANALEYASEGKRVLDGDLWTPEDEIPLRARLATLRFSAGDREAAKEEASAALEIFQRARNDIVNIYRANSLRPLAEAFHAMGMTSEAKNVYRKTLEEGFENPNLWPRAEDLAETCCSMALRGFEPDEELWEVVYGILAALEAPR